MTRTVRENATAVVLSEFLCLAGAKMLREAMQAVRVYKMEMLVLMVTICPNLEKGWMTVWVRGMAATIVVRALLVMLTPMWLTAARVRQRRNSPSFCKTRGHNGQTGSG